VQSRELVLAALKFIAKIGRKFGNTKGKGKKVPQSYFRGVFISHLDKEIAELLYLCGF
jgi:hypothetical protein